MTPRPQDANTEKHAMYMRNFVFGTEDSLVSTVGLLSGVVSAGLAKADVIVTGVILILVEALSMAVGSYLSENSAEEFKEGKDVPLGSSLRAGAIMFGSYLISGFIPLAPYFFLSARPAFIVSIIVSLIALGGLGYASAREADINVGPRIKRMIILGGFAILVGVLIGRFLPTK